MLVVDDGVDAVAEADGKQEDAKIPEGHPVVLFGSGLFVAALVLKEDAGNDAKEPVLKIELDVGNLQGMIHVNSYQVLLLFKVLLFFIKK